MNMIVSILFCNGKYLDFTCNKLEPKSFDSFMMDESADSTISINFGFVVDVDGRDLGKMNGTGFCNGGQTLMLHRSDVESINVSDAA